MKVHAWSHVSCREVAEAIRVEGAFYRVSDPAFEMTIPRWEGHEPDRAEEADATIVLPDGARRYATFMTLGAVAAVMERRQRSGECLSGQYFWCSDLIIIGQPGIPGVVEAVRDLIAKGDLAGACGLLDPDSRTE